MRLGKQSKSVSSACSLLFGFLGHIPFSEMFQATAITPKVAKRGSTLILLSVTEDI